MKKSPYNILVLLLFFAAAAVIISLKNQQKQQTSPSLETTSYSPLPKVLELGSHSCVPCKMMMPVLDTLRHRHAGKLTIEFIDVWEDRETGDRYNINTIPTQIIFDATGSEIFRHEGFWSCGEMEEKMEELGILSRRGA